MIIVLIGLIAAFAFLAAGDNFKKLLKGDHTQSPWDTDARKHSGKRSRREESETNIDNIFNRPRR